VTSLALLIAGIVLVVAGAELLLDGLLGVAARLDMSPFVLTVLFSGFELENLAAGIAANAKGLPGAAAGTFLGGTTFLALAVAGGGALITPIRAGLPRGVLAWTAVSPLPLLLVAVDGRISRPEGALLLVWSLVALGAIARAGRSREDAQTPSLKRWPALRLIAGLAVLTGGGAVLGEGIRRAVSQLGVSPSLLGNTAVAASIEAEELGRVAIPSRRGRADLAVANIAGTIVHFTALNAGIIALVKPLRLDAISVRLHLPVAVGATLALCMLLATAGQITRMTGAIMCLLYLGYVAAAITLS
jgi:cation:H+ antiporter